LAKFGVSSRLWESDAGLMFLIIAATPIIVPMQHQLRLERITSFAEKMLKAKEHSAKDINEYVRNWA
jgi:hypothetical protein